MWFYDKKRNKYHRSVTVFTRFEPALVFTVSETEIPVPRNIDQEHRLWKMFWEIEKGIYICVESNGLTLIPTK